MRHLVIYIICNNETKRFFKNLTEILFKIFRGKNDIISNGNEIAINSQKYDNLVSFFFSSFEEDSLKKIFTALFQRNQFGNVFVGKLNYS